MRRLEVMGEHMTASERREIKGSKAVKRFEGHYKEQGLRQVCSGK